MNWPRFLRAALCLLVVCCLIFNIVSIPTKALAIVDDIALGIFALIALASAGMVIVPKSNDEISAIGQNFKSSMYQWGSSAEKLDEVEAYINAFTLYDPSVGDDESPNETKIKLARGLLFGITAWIASTIMAGEVETEGEAAPDGYAYYNGVLLPNHGLSISSEYPCVFIFYDSPYYYAVSVNESYKTPYVTLNSDGSYRFGVGTVCPFVKMTQDQIVSSGNMTLQLNSYSSSRGEEIIWSNVDIYASGKLFLPGSDPMSSVDITVQPSIYVGDIPQKIQNGEADADDIELPESIDYSFMVQPGVPLVDSVVNTMSQLANGAIDYDEFRDSLMVSPEPVILRDLGGSSVSYEQGTLAAPLYVDATVTDGASLSYSWYVSVDDGPEKLIEGADSPKYIPPTDNIGIFAYRCLVTSTYESFPVSQVWSETATVVVALPGSIPVPDSDAITHSGLKGLLGNLVSSLSNFFDSVITAVKALPDSFAGWFEQIIANIISLPQSIAAAISSPLKALFFPSEDFLSDKVQALRDKYSFADSIIETANELGVALKGFGSEPPIIYMHLEDAESKYNWGGTAIALDLRWYERYKPAVDSLLSGLLWAFFVWRVYRKLPGIISGVAGEVDFD